MDPLLAVAKVELLRKMVRINVKAMQIALVNADAITCQDASRNLLEAITIGCELGEAGEFASPAAFMDFLQEQTEYAASDAYTDAPEEQEWVRANLQAIMGPEWHMRESTTT